jgi:hypothetical protein
MNVRRGRQAKQAQSAGQDKAMSRLGHERTVYRGQASKAGPE